MLTMILSVFTPAYGQSGTVYKGIDVSTHQKQIDWSQVKNSGIQFAMIRDGFGGDRSSWDSQVDSCFEANYAGATQNGIKVGVYHYSYATNVSMANDEADFVLHILNGRKLDYPVAYDLEDPSQLGVSADVMGQMIQTFCNKIQQAGYKVVVYSYVHFYNSHMTSSAVSQYDTWIANYTDASAPNFSGKYTMWQYADDGSVPGISGSCDLDYSYVDYSGTNTGPDKPIITEPMDPLTFKCDTSSYAFGTNSQYMYKITTPDTYPPVATSSNPSAVTVSAAKATYNGYVFTIYNVGVGDAVITTTAGDGRSVSFHATGTKSAANLWCDTSSYTFGTNSQYVYRVTVPGSGTPTASSSNPSAVTVSAPRAVTDGYLFTINNVGTGDAVITTTASDGSSVFFHATGTKSAANLRCDTSSYTFGANSTYCYKVWSSDTNPPRAVSSNSSYVAVSYLQKLSDGYLYRITNTGKGTATITTTEADGTSVSFPATGTMSYTPVSDTPYYFTMRKGTYYQFEFTGAPGVSYDFFCAGGSVIKSAGLKKIGGSYYFKVYAAGSGCAGMYASTTGWSQPIGVITVQ